MDAKSTTPLAGGFSGPDGSLSWVEASPPEERATPAGVMVAYAITQGNDSGDVEVTIGWINAMEFFHGVQEMLGLPPLPMPTDFAGLVAASRATAAIGQAVWENAFEDGDAINHDAEAEAVLAILQARGH